MDQAEFHWNYAIGSQALRTQLGEEVELLYGLHFFVVESGGRLKEPFPSGTTFSWDPIEIGCHIPVTCPLVNNYLGPLGPISLLHFAAQCLSPPTRNRVF